MYTAGETAKSPSSFPSAANPEFIAPINFRPTNRGNSHLAQYEFDIRKLKTEMSLYLMVFTFYNKTISSITLVHLHGSGSSATVPCNNFNFLFFTMRYFFLRPRDPKTSRSRGWASDQIESTLMVSIASQKNRKW